VSGLGIRYKKFSFEFRYGIGLLNLNTEPESDLTVKNSGFELLLSFVFL
jgi:hypothetical protein